MWQDAPPEYGCAANIGMQGIDAHSTQYACKQFTSKLGLHGATALLYMLYVPKSAKCPGHLAGWKVC